MDSIEDLFARASTLKPRSNSRFTAKEWVNRNFERGVVNFKRRAFGFCKSEVRKTEQEMIKLLVEVGIAYYGEEARALAENLVGKSVKYGDDSIEFCKIEDRDHNQLYHLTINYAQRQ